MATTVKAITNKDVLTFTKSVIESVLNGNVTLPEIGVDVKFALGDYNDKVDKMIATLEKKSKKSADGTSEKAKINAELAKQIFDILPDNTTKAVSEICGMLTADEGDKFILPDGETVVTRSKISTIMGVGVETGLFTAVSGYKVGGKGRAVKGYVKKND
jgi:hypothetical protein